jgi:hypothetical protein
MERQTQAMTGRRSQKRRFFFVVTSAHIISTFRYVNFSRPEDDALPFSPLLPPVPSHCVQLQESNCAAFCNSWSYFLASSFSSYWSSPTLQSPCPHVSIYPNHAYQNDASSCKFLEDIAHIPGSIFIILIGIGVQVENKLIAGERKKVETVETSSSSNSMTFPSAS